MVATWNYNREYEGIEISFDGKPSEEIRTKMKSAGFRWSSRQMKWYAKDTQQSRKVASEIATQGEDVGEVLTFEQKMQRDKERTEQRQERLGTKVEKLEKKSESLLDQAHKMADVIPFGQPILVGHHSEGRDRRYRDKIHNKFGKGFELQDEAKAVEQRLEGSQALARKRETPGYMSRKIDKLEADLRKFEREKEQWKTAMPEWEKRTGKLKEEIAYWKKELGEVGGLKVTQADVKVGDEILYSGKWYEVVRVNLKTVTIKNWLDIPTWTWGAEYSNIKEVRHKSYETPLEPKPKISDAEYEKAKLFLSALATARTLDELLGWQPAVKRWSIKFPDLEKELESEYQARFDYLKAAKDVSEAQRKEKASKPQSGQAKDLYKQMRKTNSVQELDDWRNRVLFEAHLPDVEEDILLRDLAAKWRVYLETRGIPALEKLDKLPLDYKNEDYYFGTEVWVHPTTTIFDDRPQKGILHFARNEGELFDVMLEGVPGTTRVQIDRIYVTKLVEKPEPRYQAPVKKTYRYASFNRPLWNGFDPGVPYNIVEIQKSDYLNDRKPHDVIETHTPISLEHIKNLELIDYAEVEEKNKLYSYVKTVFSAGPHLNQINDLIRSKKITTTEKIDEYKAKLDKQKSEREEEKDLLKAKYPDYDPKRHGAFVMKYNKEKEAEKLEQFMVNRGIIEWTPQQAIKLAADTVETLRKPDVFRVLSQNKSHAKELGAFIKSKRADLANEVEKILFEFTLPTYELYFWRLTHTPHLKEKWHIEYKVAEISDNKRREFSSFGSRYFETWEEIRNILASGTANLWVHDVRGDHTVTFKPVALGLPRTLDRIGKSYINGKFITQLIQPSYTYPDGMWGWSVQHEMMENGRLQSAGREIIAESVIEKLPEFTDTMRNEAIIREALKSYDLSVPKDKIGRAGFILDVFPREYVPMLAKLDKVARQELEPKLMQLIQAAKDELNKPNVSIEDLYKKYTSGYSVISLLGIVQQDTKDLAHSIGYELKLDTTIYTPAILLSIADKFKELAQKDYDKEHQKIEARKQKDLAELEKEKQEGGEKFWNEVKDLKVVDFEVQHDINPDKPTRDYYHVYDRTFAILENGKKVQISYVINKGEYGKRAAKAKKEYYGQFYNQYIGKPLSKWVSEYRGEFVRINLQNYLSQKPATKPKFIVENPFGVDLSKSVVPYSEQPKIDEERFKELKDGFTSYQFNIGSPEMKELTELERKLQMKEPAKTGSLPAKNIGRSPAKIDTTSKDYKSGYNTAFSGRIYPPVPAWTDQGKAEFDAGYTEGKRILYEQPKPDEQLFGKPVVEKIKPVEIKGNIIFGKPVEVLPEKPKVLGAPSKQELSLKEARIKAAQGKRLKGQQTLFSAVSTSTRLTQFEEKPRGAEPLKFKRPIPFVGRLRTPPYPFIQPKPKLLAMPSEKEEYLRAKIATISIDTSDFISEEIIKGAAIPKKGYLVVYHLTKNPEEKLNNIKLKDLITIEPYGTFGAGLYVSSIPEYWEGLIKKSGAPAPIGLIEFTLVGKFVNNTELTKRPLWNEVLEGVKATSAMGHSEIQNLVNSMLNSMGFSGRFTRMAEGRNPELIIWNKKAIVNIKIIPYSKNMSSEKDIQKVKQSKEAELHTRLMLIAEKTRLKREQNQLKKEVE